MSKGCRPRAAHSGSLPACAGELRELKRLFGALHQAEHPQYKVQLAYVHALFEKTARFRAVFDLVRDGTSDFDPDEWIQERVLGARQTCHEWPASEPQKLRVLLRLMDLCATSETVDPTALGRYLVYGRDLNEWVQAITKQVVFPLVDYLQTRLATESEVLHHLERMRRQIEWFEQEKLFAAYSANRAKCEELYDTRVREFLFAEGIDYPFSQPSSSSGKADVIARLEGDDPLVCEIKLYEANAYGITYLRRGVGQAIRYAHDYGKSSAYLVVLNLSDERLQLPSDDTADRSPPRVQIQGVTVFLIAVQAKPAPSASKDHHRQVRAVERDQLVPVVDEVTQ